MKRLLLLALCSATLFSCSQNEAPSIFCNIYGIVSDASSGEPIRNASVTLSPTNLTTVTGADGHFEFTDLDEGQYKIQCSATGYHTNSRQISVHAGGTATCDIALTPIVTSDAIQITPSSGLNFGTAYNQLEFRIENIGNAGTVSWTIQNQASWISVSPQSGSTEMGKSSSVIVTIDRSKITENATSFITVETNGGSQSVRVSVEHKSDDNGGGGGNNPGGDAGNDDNNTDTTTEDYSSARVTSCDSRIIAKIVDCKRSGSSVVFNYTLTNDGMGDIKQWRMKGPSTLGGISPKSNIYDNLGNEYLYPTMMFRNKKIGETELSIDFPEGLACKGSVTISNFSENATKLNVILGVAVYSHSTNLAGNKIKFEDIPIY